MSQGCLLRCEGEKQIPRYARNERFEYFLWKNRGDNLERSEEKRLHGFVYTAAFRRD